MASKTHSKRPQQQVDLTREHWRRGALGSAAARLPFIHADVRSTLMTSFFKKNVGQFRSLL